MPVDPKPEWVTSCPFTLEWDGGYYEFTVTLNGYGEVLAVKNHFLQLPPAARRMMAGNSAEHLMTRLQAWEGIIPYYAPLVALGYLHKGPWQKMAASLEELRARQSGRELPEPEQYIEDTWVRRLYQLDKEAASQPELFSAITKLLVEDNEVLKHGLMLQVCRQAPELAEPLFYALLPLQDHKMLVRSMYDIIASFGSETAMYFLLSKLQDRHQAFYHRPILTGLGEFRDMALLVKMRDPLLSYFSNAPVALPDDEYATLLTTFFTPFPEPKVEQFLLKILRSYRIEPAIAAYEILYKQGRGPDMVARELRYVFQQPRPPLEYIKTALAVFGKFEDRSLLPYSSELLDLFTWNCRQELDTNFIQAVAFVMKKRLGAGIYARMAPYLQHEERQIREGARLFFSQNGKTEFAHFQRELSNDDPKVRKKALLGIRALAAGFAAPHLIRPILQMKSADPALERPILLALTALVRKTPERVALPEILLATRHRQPQIRAAAALALTGFLRGRPDVLAAVESLWDDPDQVVRQAARDAYRDGLRTLRGSTDFRKR